MPPDPRFRGDDDEGPAFQPDQTRRENYPEEPVEGAKAWPSMPPIQHGGLLSRAQGSPGEDSYGYERGDGARRTKAKTG